ncbi:MAG TPA: dihydrofolate reductase family protein [Candidatus Limnocylindria bacterium]
MADHTTDGRGACAIRKVVVTNLVSLDGYVAGPGGDLSVMPIDHGFDRYNLERLRTADTILMGARSFGGMIGFWPHVLEDPSFSPAVQMDPSVAPIHAEIAGRNHEARKVVISDSLTPGDAEPWADSTTIVPRAEAHETVRALRAKDGADIVVFGSPTVWTDLLRAGLVDEVHVLVGPAMVGGGVAAFRPGTAARLRLIDHRRLDDSDLVLLAYAVDLSRTA